MPLPDRSPHLPTTAPSPAGPSTATDPSPAAATTAALARLGWDAAWATALAADPPPPGGRPGRVARSGRGSCDVLVADPGGAHGVTPAVGEPDLDDLDLHAPGLATLAARWSPALGRAAASDPTAVPAAGDWVVLAPGADPVVDRVLPRRTAVVRAQVAEGSSRDQVLAANADVAVVVEAMAPDVDLARVERLLALAWSSGAAPVVVLTKADLVAHPAALVEEVAAVAPGAAVHGVASPHDEGLEPLRALLAGGATLALLGASGVGKSTLLNALVGGGREVVRTRALRADGKGRHTTVTRELHLAPGGGAVLDTPGLRTIGLAGREALDDVFGDVEDLAASCRFADCAHDAEPGCAVQAAVEAGDLPGRRLLSYRKLLREAERREARVDARLRAELAGRVRRQQRAYRLSAGRG